MLSRRQALIAGVTAAGLTGAAPPLAASAAPGRPLTRDRFAPLVGTAFELEPARRSGARHTATLIAAPGADHTFALRFAAARPVPQGIYRLHHPALDTVELFLAPAGPIPGRLEAVVNRASA
ncbi:hypothetical protein Dfulv_24380 [Dactylosporangium fulvum]|uniref:DUF6916 domain-containing protein n=1 Tax=Dactylosporangium fulvum TaxID=53359 RepID=A0ABY5WCF2_9ACTN|nr:hypothetical protein [Dactylosporangium fulvum]UWP87207.1 hypothetical protein Dfulv_24380 [Dactylosporangium fulvum]